MKYNIGQILKLERDIETESALGNKKIRKAGTKMWVTARKTPAVIYLNGDIQFFSKDEGVEVEGYSTKGIAEFLYIWLNYHLGLEEALSDYDIEKNEFIEEVANALEELGMYDHTGNRG